MVERVDVDGYLIAPILFWTKVRRADESEGGCWWWWGGTTSAGYGAVRVPRATGGYANTGAHRISWMLTRGPIPKGLVLDHLCKNKRCVNPDHLEPVTVAQNNWRVDPRARNPRRGKPRAITEAERISGRYRRERSTTMPYEHGTWKGYNLGACRCAPCKEAGRAYLREDRRKKKARGVAS